jgi:fructokinase
MVDTVGAGDAFAAGLLHEMLVGRRPAEALAFANRLGALVASRPGALPPWSTGEIG